MSGIAGILRFDGGPVDPVDLARMSASIAHRGPDGTTYLVEGPLGLAHLQHRTHPSSLAEHQPLRSPSRRTIGVLDGRIDNRREVIAALGSARPPADGGDVALLLAAYERWGRAGFARLVGDLAAVLWDEELRELVCVRDPMAKRPLFYLHDRRRGIDALRVASEVPALLAEPAIRRVPNEGMVAELLANRIGTMAETVFEGILRVPPAHLLRARPDGSMVVERYWSWDESTARRRDGDRSRDHEHVERLRSVLTTVVTEQLEAIGPVAAELSGGVDSSSIVGLATHVLRERGGDPLELFALVLPGSRWDESHHLHAVTDFLGTTATEHEPHPMGAAFYDAELRRTLEPAGPPNLAMHHDHVVEAAGRGCRVLLTGQGGDEWFTGSAHAIADDLRHLHLRGLRDRAAQDRRLWPARTPLHHLVRDGLLPLLGRPRTHLPRMDLIPQAFRDRVHLEERLRRDVARGPSLATAQIAGLLDAGGLVHSAEKAEQAFTAWGIERRSPFDDRRVVELALALPDDLRRRGTVTKWIIREALEGLVPPSVLGRRGKSTFGHLFAQELAAQGGPELFRSWAIADLGWVDPGALEPAYREVAATHPDALQHPLTWSLWRGVCIERWFRAIFAP